MPRRSPRAARLLIVTLIMAIAVIAPTNVTLAAGFFEDDFESGTLAAWTSTTAFTAQQAITNAGVWAGRATATSGPAFASKTISGQTDVYLRAFVRVVSHAGTNQLLRMGSSTGSGSTISLILLSSNQLQVKNHVLGGEFRNTGVTLTPGTFVDLQLHLHIGGANGAAELWVNGVPAGGLGGAWNFGTTPIDSVVLGAQAGTTPAMDVVFDDVEAATTFIGGGGGPTIPPTPTGLSPNPFYNRVDLTWNASSGATGYTVYRGGTAIGTTANTNFSDTTVLPEQTYQYSVDAFNSAGNSAPTATISVTTPPAPTGGGSVVMAAGDIACDPDLASSFNGGNGTAKQCRQKYTANLLAGADRVLALGDTQYTCGAASEYSASYDKSWGAYKSKTYPAIGDQEYVTGTGCGSSGAGYFNYFGSLANGPNGYYSYDFAGWHFVVLNSECAKVGGCGEGSLQNNWLEADLAATTEACTIAYWHRPLFFSKAGSSQVSSTFRPFWDDLYAASAEIVLTGHSHWYERFNPQTPAGVASPNGIVEWVVGTGGKSHNTNALAAPGSRHPNSATANASTFGVLKLTLNAGSYDWRYLVEGSSSYNDVGTASCH